MYKGSALRAQPRRVQDLMTCHGGGAQVVQNKRSCRHGEPPENPGSPTLNRPWSKRQGAGAQVLQQRALMREGEVVREVPCILAVAHLLQEGSARLCARAARCLHALHLRIAYSN